MPHYKLTFFDARGSAEVIRQIFVYAEQPFEDVRIPRAEWTPEKKEELQLPWGQIPVLEVDGVKMAQSFAIIRYLAKKYNLAGKNEAEEFRCDEIMEAIRDLGLKSQSLLSAVAKNETEHLEELKKTFLEVDGPVMLKRFDSILEKGENTWFVGDRITYVDIFFTHAIYTYNTLLNVQLENDFPAIAKLTKAVQEEPKLKEWIEKRPKTRL